MASAQDAEIARYLNKLAEYKCFAEKSGSNWSSGFIDLSRAQLARPIGQHNYDLNIKPNLLYCDGTLQKEKEGSNSLAMFGGAFAPQALKDAQTEFREALRLSIEKRQAELELKRLETKFAQV